MHRPRGKRAGLDATAIRRLIRERLSKGELAWPSNLRRLLAQLGAGDHCYVCSETIEETEIEYTFSDSGNGHVHRECFVLWMEALEEGRRRRYGP